MHVDHQKAPMMTCETRDSKDWAEAFSKATPALCVVPSSSLFTLSQFGIFATRLHESLE